MGNSTFGIIGGGNMAEAILRGALASGFLQKDKVVVADVSAQRREAMAKTGVTCVDDNLAPARCHTILLAVKPQVMAAVLDPIAATVAGDALVISIAAGVSTTAIDRRLGGRGRIVRVMPNTPMLAGAGMSALCAGPRATPDDLAWAKGLFAASGQTVIVEEPMMDAVTAVSGSGPAYFFYLIEAMIEAGVMEGLPSDVAATLAIATCAGAAKLLAQTGDKPEALRAKVTSPNGTTQRAIETMEIAGVKAALITAVRAAAARSRELGR
jgi:pyrroline-5-carboxylate reductase